MAGGIFIKENKVRPGFYHRFVARANERELLGELGVAALPMELDYGAKNRFIEIFADSTEEEFIEKLGYKRSELLLVNECLKRAYKLLIYRTGGGEKASLEIIAGISTAKAKHVGKRGNDFSVSIIEDINNAGKFAVCTFINEIMIDKQDNLTNAQDILDNAYLEFSGIGELKAVAGGHLTGGSNEAATKASYEAFLNALDGETFNAFGLPIDNEEYKTLFFNAAKRYTEIQGKLVQCILPDYNGEGHEAVSSVKNGVILQDGNILDNARAVAYLTGAAASAGPATSLTYSPYDGAIAPDIKLTDSQIKEALQKGQVVFVEQKDIYGNKIAVIEQDINTLKLFSEDRPECWGKNRVVRALYYLVNSLNRLWHLHYIGKTDNNEAGRNLFKADLVKLMGELVDMGAFENFSAENDIEVMKGNNKESVAVSMGVLPVDAMEKMYFTVEVK